ncbi:class I SAM-dependent methyltransferase [Liquorilactobacillus capillatus]|uniref:AdoMet-dependent methyltransferase n=1 Tax=Liquorilactobacillus capillatus DSM 19910 TaxID=1423731 RepID=A0A0R1M3R5_9LACO|nr:class I SAM-dependent methyltransferase [Liquorilactobacillus capillatus]KRL02688.1 AdoMet-dependent methyltransferase [Liquorilactobacillus capillatus DSM 19910]
MKSIEITNEAARKYKDGYPKLDTKDFIAPYQGNNGELLRLVARNQFVAYAYLAKQRNSDGWILTVEEKNIDEEFFRKLFTMAQIKRANFYYAEETNVFRFFNGVGDGLGGLTIDYYAGYYVFTFDNQGLYQHRETLYRAFDAAVKDYKGIYEKLQFNVQKNALKNRHVKGDKAPEILTVVQNNVKYLVYLNTELNNFALDKRELLADLKEKYAAEKIVFSGFSRNGAVGASAMLGGAFKTVNIDLTAKANERLQKQFLANGIDPEKQEIRTMDVQGYLDYAFNHHIEFDVTFIDPPVFVRSKKRTFNLSKDYPDLIKAALKATKKTGLLILTANTASLSLKKLKAQLNDVFTQNGSSFEIIKTYHSPRDFATLKEYRQSDYFKALVLQIKR